MQTGVFYPADMFIIMSVTFEIDICPPTVEYLINSFCMCSLILVEIPQLLFLKNKPISTQPSYLLFNVSN